MDDLQRLYLLVFCLVTEDRENTFTLQITENSLMTYNFQFLPSNYVHLKEY